MYINLMNPVLRLAQLLQEKRAIDAEVDELKRNFSIPRTESDLIKLKYAVRRLPSELIDATIIRNNEKCCRFRGEWLPLRIMDERYLVLDATVRFRIEGKQLAEHILHIFVHNKEQKLYLYRTCWFGQFEPLHVRTDLLYNVKYDAKKLELLLLNQKARKIQRCVRQWLWKPYYRSGRVGYHARKGFELMQREKSI
jgi:hypothetical protein